MISSICGQQAWKIISLWFFRTIILVVVYALVSYFPKPDWVCDTGSRIKATTSDLIKALDGDSLGKAAMTVDVIDPRVNKILQLFPLYMEHNSKVLSKDTNRQIAPSLPPEVSFVKIFYLQNFNFTHFGRNWVNEIHQQELHSKHLEPDSKNYVFTQFKIKKIQQNQKLPDCVTLKVPHGAMPTKICVHYPQDDNFISNRLRDTGFWEMKLVFQMEQFFKDNPRSQLVDLGCNVGVFTLFAASMTKPVLAVDILPSNLALIQLSIATNDENMEHDNDVDKYLFGYNNKSQPKYSDLITTVHNAIYSRHSKMYVYLKNDLNLGGTEVKEWNSHNNSQHIYLEGIIDTNRHSIKGKHIERTTFQQNNRSPDTAAGSTKILVDAVCLDDLIPYVHANLSVFLKMDIEGSEPDVFLCASNFFMHVDVKVILMEILFHRYSNQGKNMVKFLLQHNMVPSEDVTGRTLLDTDLNSMYKWPENIFWVKVR